MVNDYLVIDPQLRTITIPESELTFGVESDLRSERKYFQCPRYVGNNIDLASCFVRVNFRNANGDLDAYLVEDLVTDGDNVTFSWELTSKVTQFKGQVAFVVCACRPTTGSRIVTEWNTTVGYGIVLEGLEPDTSTIDAETSDVVAQLLAMVEEQTELVRTEGASQVTNIRAVTTTSIEAVETAAETAQSDAVTEIEAKGVNTLASIPDDYTALSGVVDTLTRTTAPAIVCEAAGNAVVVTDASDMPIQGLRVFGKSTQDGVPTPEAPVEIVSVEKPVVMVAGKNLLNIITGGTTVGVTETVTNGLVSFNGIAESNGGRKAWGRTPVFTLPAGEYYLSMTVPSGEAPAPCLTTSGVDKVVTSNLGNFVVQDTVNVYLGFNYIKGQEYNAQNVEVMLECNTVGTEYEPYKPTQSLTTTHTLPGIRVKSGGNYTDADGQQWICDEIDLGRGVYVQRVGGNTFDGSVSAGWVRVTNYGSAVRFDYRKAPLKPNTTVLANWLDAVVISKADAEGVSAHTIEPYIQMQISQTRLSTADVSGLMEYFATNPLKVLFVLNTPVETPLSESEIATYRELHSNHPNTTVLNDSGAHMVVKYAADTKLYIDNKIKEVLA